MISDREASKADLRSLREFAQTRSGVEAYVEPQTSVTQTTVVLVAADGEWTRKRVASARDAADLARRLKIPIYDANRVGYPQRMRDYTVRTAKEQSSKVESSRGSLTPAQFAAVMTLESIAGVEPLGKNPTPEELARLLRSARAVAHPDRRAGDRSQWDKVEAASRVLDLS